MIYEVLEFSRLANLSNNVVLGFNGLESLLDNIIFDVETLLLVTVFVEDILRLDKPLVNQSNFIVDLIKLLPLLLGLRDYEAKVILGAFNQVFYALLLGLDLLEGLYDVHDDGLGLVELLLEQPSLELVEIVLQVFYLLGVIVYLYFLIRQFRKQLLLFIALLLDHFQFYQVNVFVDHGLIHRQELALESLVVLVALLYFGGDLTYFRIHFFSVEVWVILG